MNRTINVGIVGCGNISDRYFDGLKQFEILRIVSCADVDSARAQAKADQYQLRAAGSVDELLHDPAVDIVVNLTIPKAHAAVNTAALRAGKHVYCEKPFALNSSDGAAVLALAREKNLLVGSAPDTFLGSGIQTARKAIDDGLIGRPFGAMAFMLCHGHESWHPNPQFYYEQGGGPMFDMGPYYLTALVSLLGPATRVSGSTSCALTERIVTSEPLRGSRIKVQTPTHLTGTVDFASHATATLVMSFDVWSVSIRPLMIFGTEGNLEVPDPNNFSGAVKLCRAGSDDYEELPLVEGHGRGRGTGVADMAYSLLRRNRPHRANGEMANHVVEIMESFEKSSLTSRHLILASSCAKPAALPGNLGATELDA